MNYSNLLKAIKANPECNRLLNDVYKPALIKQKKQGDYTQEKGAKFLEEFLFSCAQVLGVSISEENMLKACKHFQKSLWNSTLKSIKEEA